MCRFEKNLLKKWSGIAPKTAFINNTFKSYIHVATDCIKRNAVHPRNKNFKEFFCPNIL